MAEAWDLNLFHIHLGYLKDHIYFLKDMDALVIASKEGGVLNIWGIFAKKPLGLDQLVKNLPFDGISRIEFQFMPDWLTGDYVMVERETEPFFVKNIGITVDGLKFPSLCT